MTKTIETIVKMKEESSRLKTSGKSIAFVPTMGSLHEGHLSLLKEGKKSCDALVVSIFVNPTQFGPEEDFKSYPRDIERDKKLLSDYGVDILFKPVVKEMFPEGFETYINVEDISKGLCGDSRPGHFRGVATVVAKLLNIVSPDIAFFGEKDYQQFAVIRRMGKDLNYQTEIKALPTVREKDGLAMSSRNLYLSDEERCKALSIYRALSRGNDLFLSGEKDALKIVEAAKKEISGSFEIDYLEVRDPETLLPVKTVANSALLAFAGRIGKTRLIDNILLKED